MNVSNHLQSLEEKLLQSSTRKNAAELAALLTGNFREFGSSGRIFDKASIIAELRDESPRELSLHTFQAIVASPDVVLVTYISRRGAGGTSREFLRSSIWIQEDGTWKIRFHHGTPIPLDGEALKD